MCGIIVVFKISEVSSMLFVLWNWGINKLWIIFVLSGCVRNIWVLKVNIIIKIIVVIVVFSSWIFCFCNFKIVKEFIVVISVVGNKGIWNNK